MQLYDQQFAATVTQRQLIQAFAERERLAREAQAEASQQTDESSTRGIFKSAAAGLGNWLVETGQQLRQYGAPDAPTAAPRKV